MALTMTSWSTAQAPFLRLRRHYVVSVDTEYL